MTSVYFRKLKIISKNYLRLREEVKIFHDDKVDFADSCKFKRENSKYFSKQCLRVVSNMFNVRICKLLDSLSLLAINLFYDESSIIRNYNEVSTSSSLFRQDTFSNLLLVSSIIKACDEILMTYSFQLFYSFEFIIEILSKFYALSVWMSPLKYRLVDVIWSECAYTRLACQIIYI